MNTKSLYISAIAFFMAISSGCSDFEEINTDPDKPAVATAPWLATNMLTSITSTTISSTKGFTVPYQRSKYLLWSERKEGPQYNSLGRTSFTDQLAALKNVKPMNQYASVLEPGLFKSYEALGHFIRAWQFFSLTMTVGDIPYSEAIKGDEGLIKPVYDTQKDVFKGIIDELDKANTLFAEGSNISGDFIYKGDVDKWRRLVNSFELYVLINLHKKTSDADFNVINKFKEVSERPLMRNFNDNFAVTYNGSKDYCYPWSHTPNGINSFRIYSMLSTTYIDLLKQTQDKRLFYVAEPAEAMLKSGKSASDFGAYIGVEPADEFSLTVDKKNKGEYSDLNKRYVESATAEPVGLFCHWDVEFILAEAVIRGWITGDPQTHYSNGIKSSMRFYAHYVPDTYNHGVKLDEDYIESYPSTVMLKGNTEEKLKQIISQKYLCNFFHDGNLSWFEFRRTGYPEFVLNPSSNMNPTDNTKFPVRWQYPQNELDYNRENVQKAIDSQYAGSDDFNGIMWILK